MILKSGTYRTASIKIAVLFSSIIFISSCIKKERFDKFEMDPANMGWGLPIIDSKLTLKDIVSTIKDNKNLDASLLDSSYTFTYYDTLKTVSAEKLVLLPSQQISTQISLPNNFPVLLPAGQEIPGNFNGKEVIAFAANAQLKSMQAFLCMFQQSISNRSTSAPFESFCAALEMSTPVTAHWY